MHPAGQVPKLNVAGSSPVSLSTFAPHLGGTGRMNGGKWPSGRVAEERLVATL